MYLALKKGQFEKEKSVKIWWIFNSLPQPDDCNRENP